MQLMKDNVTITLDNEDHINAFLTSGWVEAKASAQTVREEPKAEPKEEKAEEKVSKPRVSRKKQEK